MPGPRLPLTTRYQIAYVAKEKSQRATAKQFNVAPATVAGCVARDKENAGEVVQQDRHRRGRPRKLSERDDRRIKRFTKQNKRLSIKSLAPKLLPLGIDASHNTVRNSLKRTGVKQGTALKKPFLSKDVQRQRREWAERYKDYDFKMGIYVDESKLNGKGSNKVWIWREDKEKYNPDCLLPSFSDDREGVMVWAAIWHGGRSELLQFDCSASTGKNGGVTAQIYCDQVTSGPLRLIWNRARTTWRAYGGQPLILEDGGSAHKGAAAAEARRLKMKFFKHPPYSPDLNPIEPCWAWLKWAIDRQETKPRGPTELFAVAARLWQEMPQAVIDSCIEGLFKRREIVKKRRGLHSDVDI